MSINFLYFLLLLFSLSLQNLKHQHTCTLAIHSLDSDFLKFVLLTLSSQDHLRSQESKNNFHNHKIVICQFYHNDIKAKAIKAMGKTTSILARIKEVVPHFIGIHCIFHHHRQEKRKKNLVYLQMSWINQK